MYSLHGSRDTISVLLSLLALAQFTVVQAGVSLDPVKNFCRRVGHSSVVKNGTLYINGGKQTFVDFGANGQQDTKTITSGINENLVAVDMTSSWNWKTNVSVSQHARSMGGSVFGMTWPVNVHDGALFGGKQSSNNLIMFGGTTADFNQSFPNFEVPPTTQYAMWSYDIHADIWTAMDTSASSITIPSWGAKAEAPDRGLAFYVGGQIDRGTANSTQFLGDSTVGLGGMVVLDTTTNNIKNVTVEETVKSNRQGSGMVYVDNFGDSGVLVLLGGQTQSDGLIPMDEISIFDVGTTDLSDSSSSDKNVWYQQRATGDIPSARTDFCLVAAAAQDNSSTTIYLYGGRSNGSIFDDVYVLSVPSFTWVKVFTGKDARWSVTCHFMPPRQMVTVGGGGKSNNISSDCDWEQKSLAVLDLSTMGWGSVFDASAPLYEVPDSVVAAIGGGPTGNATKVAPDGGWADTGLSQLFTIKTAVGTSPTESNGTTPTSKPSASFSPSAAATSGETTSSTGLSSGAIAGVAVAGVVGVAIVCGVLLFCWLRSRRRSRQNAGMEAIPEKDPLPSYTSASTNASELLGSPQAAELPSKQQGALNTPKGSSQGPVENDAGTVHGLHTAEWQRDPVEME